MEWISVKDKKPKKDQLVLVWGFMETELYNKNAEPSIGLVTWKSVDYSESANTCYYSVFFSGITHWMPVQPPKLN